MFLFNVNKIKFLKLYIILFYRFGAGLVIYWFGYIDMVSNCAENSDLIYVTKSFPDKSDLEFLTFNE